MRTQLSPLATAWTVAAMTFGGLGRLAVADSSLGFTPQGQPLVRFDPIPAAVEYRIDQAADLGQPFAPGIEGSFDGFQWSGSQPAVDGAGFYRIRAQVLPPEEIAGYNLLSRITYGPTPDDLERVKRIGPDAYLAEQLAAETIPDEIDTPKPFVLGWQKVTLVGTGTSSRLYLSLDGPGDAYVDDFRLVAGAGDDGTKPNLLRNGGFESALAGSWLLDGPNVTNSTRSAIQVKEGAACLHLVDDAPTTVNRTLGTTIYQDITPALSTGTQYTLTFWHYSSESSRSIKARLSGSGINAVAPLDSSRSGLGGIRKGLDEGTANIAALRTWHVQRAVRSPRQLNEVLRQFFENHFVTEYNKSRDWLDGKLPNELVAAPATRMEYRENQLWAAALLKPDVTFHEMMKISSESPAMIIYLDTVGSAGAVNAKGEVTKIANENYGRELLELFGFGVDNGYDQQDIVQLSRVWTGWTVELTAPGQETNPFAKKSTVYVDPTIVTNKTRYTNLQGEWSFIFNSANHYTGPKYLFSGHNDNGTLATNTPKTVPARFGAPWAGRPYQLILPARTGNAGLQDGYDVLQHMADQPFTQEFLSVKFCQLFVHDDFHLGYDFTDDTTTPEEDLVHAMMLAWENPPGGGPKGQLRPVLKVLFGSALFRSSAASSQKVKTPLEYAVSAVRALRADRGDGRFTAETDGVGPVDLMDRAGRMSLFNRAEPDGYPESAPGWISAGTLSERLRFVQAALIAPGGGGRGDAGDGTTTDPVALLQLKKVPINDAEKVADYFLGILFPDEGRGNLGSYRKQAIQFLNTADDGTTASPLSGLTPALTDTRIRGVVAALLTTARFQEQ